MIEVGYLRRRICRNYRLYQHRILRHRPACDPSGAYVVSEQKSRLIARHKPVGAILVLDGYSAPVAVGICGYQDIRILPLCIFYAERHGLPDLRIRIRACWKMPVRLRLLVNQRDPGVSSLPQGSRHRQKPGSVERCIYYRHILVHPCVSQNAHGQHIPCIFIIKTVRDIAYHARAHTRLKAVQTLHILKLIQQLYLREYICRRLCGYLTSVRAIYLISVVFARIVRGRHHDARIASELSNRIGKTRRRHQLTVDVHPDTICREDTCGCP